MSIKDDLLKLRDRITGVNKESESIDLNDKVDEFINWYTDNMVKGYYNKVGEYNIPNRMRNFIEKMAVWYELKYPTSEIEKVLPFNGEVNTSSKELKDHFSYDKFKESLSWYEKDFLTKSWYNTISYFNSRNDIQFNLSLDDNGIIEHSSNIDLWTNSKLKDEDLIGLHVSKVADLLRKSGVVLPLDNELEKLVKHIGDNVYCRDEMLNCVMYRIIERGGVEEGPRRAFLFAREFGRNIDIPMKYGVDYSDLGLRTFVNECIKAGGSKDLECYVDYFGRTDRKEMANTISVQDLLLIVGDDLDNFYTPEENMLHKRLVRALKSRDNR